MNNSNLIKDTSTRNAIKQLEDTINRIELISTIKIPHDADETTKLIIKAINKITNSYKRKT